MNWLKKIFDFYIHASIHVALAVVSLLLTTWLFLNISIPKELILFVFFATLFCYNFIKDGKLIVYPEKKWSPQKLVKHGLSGLSLLAAVYCGYFIWFQIWWFLIIIMLLIILYMFPVYPRNKNLRSLGVLKVIIVAFIWAGVTVAMPLLYLNVEWNWDHQLLSIQRFLLIIALIIPFEIRDMHFDPPGILTIPRRIGIKRTKQLGVLLVFLANFLVFLRDDIYDFEIVARAIMLIVFSWLILKTPTYPSKYYAAFWVEALPIFWLGVIYLTIGFF